jgi:hypothetical protein
MRETLTTPCDGPCRSNHFRLSLNSRTCLDTPTCVDFDFPSKFSSHSQYQSQCIQNSSTMHCVLDKAPTTTAPTRQSGRHQPGLVPDNALFLPHSLINARQPRQFHIPHARFQTPPVPSYTIKTPKWHFQAPRHQTCQQASQSVTSRWVSNLIG